MFENGDESRLPSARLVRRLYVIVDVICPRTLWHSLRYSLAASFEEKISPQQDRPDGIQDIGSEPPKKRNIEIPRHGLDAINSSEYSWNTEKTNCHECSNDNPENDQVVRQSTTA